MLIQYSNSSLNWQMQERRVELTLTKHISQTNSKDSSQIGQNNGNQLDVNGSIMASTNSGGFVAGNFENGSSFVSTGNASTEEKSITTSTYRGLEGQGFTTEQEGSANTPLSGTSINLVDLSETTMNNPTGGILSDAFVSSGLKNIPTIGIASEIVLDERSLLACVVRPIPPGSGCRIRITSTVGAWQDACTSSLA